MKWCKFTITFLVILSLLCQNVTWAYGRDKLAKGAGCADRKLRSAARAYQEILAEARRRGHVDIPPHLDARGAVTNAIATGEIPREIGEQILRVLEGQGLDGLRKWYEENRGRLTEATRLVFLRLLSSDEIFKRFLEEVEAECIRLFKQPPASISIDSILVAVRLVLRTHPEFNVIADKRSYHNGLLDITFIGHDMAVKRAVNPDDKPLTGLYAGAGADVSNFLLSTNAAVGYFVDDGYGEERTLAGRPIEKYKEYKFSKGYAHDEDVRYIYFDALISELEAIGVSGGDIEGVRAKREEYLRNGGNIKIEFMWAYPGQEPVKRTIHLIHADITNHSKYPPVLEKALSGGVDFYYQRAGGGINHSEEIFSNFINRISSGVKTDGLLLIDTARVGGGEVDPIRDVKNAVIEEINPTPEMGYWADFIKPHGGYGWDVKIFRKVEDKKPSPEIQPAGRVAGARGLGVVEIFIAIPAVILLASIGYFWPAVSVWISIGLGAIGAVCITYLLLRRIEGFGTDEELLRLIIREKAKNRVFTIRPTTREHEYKVYENNAKAGSFEVAYEKGAPLRARLVLGEKKKREIYELNKDEINRHLLNKFLSRRRFVKNMAIGAAAGSVAGFFGWGIFRRPKRVLSTKESGVIEELKRLASEIADPRAKRYAEDFVDVFVKNGRVLDSPAEVHALDMGNILFRYDDFNRAVYMNYRLYRLESLNKFLAQGSMVHEGKHVADHNAGSEVYKKARPIQDAWNHLTEVEGLDVNRLSTRDLMVDSDGNWKKFPDADFYAYQLMLLQMYCIANGEVSAYVEEYNFYRSVFGDLREYLKGFRRDGDAAKSYLQLMMENLFEGAIRGDGSLDEDVVKRNYLMKVVQKGIGDMRQRALLSDVLFIESRRGTISYTPSNGLPYTLIDEGRFLDWLRTGVFVDKDGTRIDLMGLDLGLSKQGALWKGLPIAFGIVGQGDADKKTENIHNLERLRDMVLEKVREAEGKRPVVLRILGAADTGKSVFANAIRDGLNGILGGGVFTYDDPDIPRLSFAGLLNKQGIFAEHPGVRVIMVVGLLGAENFGNEDVDINVLLEADEDTIRENFREKVERFPPEQLETLLAMEGARRVLRRKATLDEVLEIDPVDRELDIEMSLPGIKKDFVFDMSRDNRPSPDEIKRVFQVQSEPAGEEKEYAMREYLQRIRPGSFEVVGLGRLMSQFGLDEGTVVRVLESLGFRPVKGDPERWKRVGRLDGCIMKGVHASAQFQRHINRIRENDITRRYRERIISLSERAGRRVPGEIKIYGFNSIVKDTDDFVLGRNYLEDRELFIAEDVIAELEARGPPTLVDEYLLHEILCPVLGHKQSILVQQAIFPHHYPDKKKLQKQRPNDPYKGLLGAALRDIIDRKVLARSQAVLTGREIYLTGRKEFHLPHELAGRVIVETDERREWVTLVDRHKLGNWLEVSKRGEEYFISIPGHEERLAADRRCIGLVYNNFMGEFVDGVIQSGYNPHSRAKAIREYLVKEGVKKGGCRMIDMAGLRVDIGEFYDENRDTISIYRDRGMASRYIAIVDNADPENYIVLERRGDSVYLVVRNRVVKLYPENKFVWFTQIREFKKFDLKIPRPVKSKVVKRTGSAALGHTTFNFYAGSPVLVERREGTTHRGEEWQRDKITFKDPTSKAVIAEIERIGIDRFAFTGDGRSVTLVGNHLYLNRIIWDFPDMASDALKRYFTEPEQDRGDMPSYKLFAKGVIIRAGYPYTDIALDAEARYDLYTDLREDGDAVASLADREKEVLRLRLGSDSRAGLTLEEIGRRLDITRAGVKQIEAKAIRKWARAVTGNTAIATAGMYTPEQHDKTNKRIRSVVQGVQGVRVQDVRPEVWASLDSDTRQALEDVMLFLLPPEDPEYPYYLRVEKNHVQGPAFAPDHRKAGPLEYQVAHAGSNQGQGRFIYMTQQAFMELPVGIVRRILEREARLARTRYEARVRGEEPLASHYDGEVREILTEIDKYTKRYRPWRGILASAAILSIAFWAVSILKPILEDFFLVATYNLFAFSIVAIALAFLMYFLLDFTPESEKLKGWGLSHIMLSTFIMVGVIHFHVILGFEFVVILAMSSYYIVRFMQDKKPVFYKPAIISLILTLITYYTSNAFGPGIRGAGLSAFYFIPCYLNDFLAVPLFVLLTPILLALISSIIGFLDVDGKAVRYIDANIPADVSRIVRPLLGNRGLLIKTTIFWAALLSFIGEVLGIRSVRDFWDVVVHFAGGLLFVPVLNIEPVKRAPVQVFSLGGNSLLTGAGTRGLDPTKEYDFEKIKAIQRANVRKTLAQLLPQIKDGGIITHGNGPEVGILLHKKLGRPAGQEGDEDYLPGIVRETQAWIGDDIRDVLIELGVPEDKIEVVITKVAVDPDDPAFSNPTKPIGPGPREGPDNRVRVASPKPLKIVEIREIRRALAKGKIVVCVGGGGIPVNIYDFSEGMPAVIDKDFATALLVEELHETGPPIRRVVISTAEPCAYLNYGKPNKTPIHRATVGQIEQYIEEGHFAPGKMLPKIQAALEIVESGAADEVVITSPDFISRIGEENIGTVIVRDNGTRAHSLWSNNKIERYVRGPGDLFRDRPDIQERLRRAIGQGGPYTEWERGTPRIVVNSNQKNFIDWYEREFGLISENKALTYHRAYVHELFHVWIRRVNLGTYLREAFSRADAQAVARFLNDFNGLFRVTPRIEPQNLDSLYEEIGARYLSGLWEDPVVMIHPVYRIGNMWELINKAIEKAGEDAGMPIYTMLAKGVRELEEVLARSVRHVDTGQDREFYAGLKRDIQAFGAGRVRFHRGIEFAQRLSDLGVVEINDGDGLRINPVLMEWMRNELKRKESRPEEVYIVVSNLRMRVNSGSGVITEITDSRTIEEYTDGRFSRKRRFEVLHDTRADVPVLKYAVFPVYGEYGLKSGRLTGFEKEYMRNFIYTPLIAEFARLRIERRDTIPPEELNRLAGMIANNLVRLQEASLRDLANEGIIPRDAFLGLLERRPFDISELAGIVYGMVSDYRRAGFSQRDQEKLLARFIPVMKLGAFMNRHKSRKLSKSDAINILFKYTWRETSPDDAVELAEDLQTRYGISRSDAFYFVSTYDEPEEMLEEKMELARQIHGRHKVLKLKPVKGRTRVYAEQEVQVPFSDVFWFVKKYKAQEAERKLVKALDIVSAYMDLGVPYTIGMFYVKTYGVVDGADKLDEACDYAERIQPEVNRGRQGPVSISISDIMFFIMRHGPKKAESRIRKALRDIDSMMAEHGISYRDAMRVAKGEVKLEEVRSGNSAVATAGMYTPEQHDKTNKRIRSVVSGLASVRVQDVRPEVWASLDPKTQQALEDVVLFLLPPEDPEYPYYLRAEVIDGKLEYQVAHAGSNQGQARFVYMTRQAFMDLPREILARILKREARLAGERFSGRRDGGGYDSEAGEILEGIERFTEDIDFVMKRIRDLIKVDALPALTEVRACRPKALIFNRLLSLITELGAGTLEWFNAVKVLLVCFYGGVEGDGAVSIGMEQFQQLYQQRHFSNPGKIGYIIAAILKDERIRISDSPDKEAAVRFAEEEFVRFINPDLDKMDSRAVNICNLWVNFILNSNEGLRNRLIDILVKRITDISSNIGLYRVLCKRILFPVCSDMEYGCYAREKAHALFGPIISEEVNTREDAWDRIFNNEDNARKFFQTATLLRLIYPFYIDRKDPRPPLQYAIEEGAFVQIGPNLFITPVTESFRRHIIFGKEGDKVKFAFEVVIPGQRAERMNVDIEKRWEIARRILDEFPEKRYCVEPLFMKEFPLGVYEFYGKDAEFSDFPPKVIAFGYDEDGKRLGFMTKGMLGDLASRLGIPQDELRQTIEGEVGEISLALQRLGYSGEGDYHIMNLRLIVRNGRIRIVLVGDFEVFEELDGIGSAAQPDGLEYFLAGLGSGNSAGMPAPEQLFQRFLETVEAESLALYKEPVKGLNPYALRLLILYVLRKHREFRNIVDRRPHNNKLLCLPYAGHDMAVRKAVNPDNRPLTGIYGGAGADISNFLLSTNAKVGYFVDEGYGKVSEYEEERVAIYKKFKFERGHAHHGDVESFHFYAILEELKAIGVSQGDIDRIRMMKDEYERSSGNITIEFDWAYPGEESRRRTIHLVRADITEPSQYPPSLQEVLRGKVDFYYQRAGEDINLKADRFMEVIASGIKLCGFIVIDPRVLFNKEKSEIDPAQVIKNAVIEEIGPTAEMKYWAGAVGSSNRYGWDVKIYRKALDGRDYPSGGRESKDFDELEFDLNGVVIKSGNYSRLVRLCKDYVSESISEENLRKELRRCMDGYVLDLETVKLFLIEWLIEALKIIKEHPDKEVLAGLLFGEIFGNPDNKGRDMMIRIATNLPRNSSRYYKDGKVIVVFNSGFIETLMQYPVQRKAGWLFAERLFHELCHKNPSRNLDRIEEETRVILDCDLVLYEKIGQNLIKEKDLKGIKHLLRSRRYFRFLQYMLSGDIRARDREFNREIKRLTGLSEHYQINGRGEFNGRLYSRRAYWKRVKQDRDRHELSELEELEGLDITAIHGNVLRNKRTGKGILILGQPVSGKSNATLHLVSSDFKNADPGKEWEFVSDDSSQVFFIGDRLVAGRDTAEAESALIYHRDKTGKKVPARIKAVRNHIEIDQIIYLSDDLWEDVKDPKKLVSYVRGKFLYGNASARLIRKMAKVPIHGIRIPRKRSHSVYERVTQEINRIYQRNMRRSAVQGYLRGRFRMQRRAPRGMGLFPISQGKKDSQFYYCDSVVVNNSELEEPGEIVRDAEQAVELYKRDKKRNKVIWMEVNEVTDAYVIIEFRGKHFVVRERLLEVLGIGSEQEFLAHLSSALARQKKAFEIVKGISSHFPKAPPAELDFDRLPDVLVVELMNASPYFGANCTGDGWIGVNELLARVEDKDLKGIIFEAILLHELRHEASVFLREWDSELYDVLFLFWSILESGLTFDKFLKLIKRYINNSSLEDEFMSMRNIVMQALLSNMARGDSAVRKSSAEMVIEIGHRFNVETGSIFIGNMKSWLVRHKLLKDGRLIPYAGMEDDRQRMYGDITREPFEFIMRTIRKFCMVRGIPEPSNLRTIRNMFQITGPVRWMIDAKLKENQQVEGGTLFGEDIDNKNFEDLALWPVDSAGRLRLDLLDWLWSWQRKPGEEYLGLNRTNRVSLKEFCRLNTHEEAQQLGFPFEDETPDSPEARHMQLLIREDLADSEGNRLWREGEWTAEELLQREADSIVTIDSNGNVVFDDAFRDRIRQEFGLGEVAFEEVMARVSEIFGLRKERFFAKDYEFQKQAVRLYFLDQSQAAAGDSRDNEVAFINLKVIKELVKRAGARGLLPLCLGIFLSHEILGHEVGIEDEFVLTQQDLCLFIEILWLYGFEFRPALASLFQIFNPESMFLKRLIKEYKGEIEFLNRINAKTGDRIVNVGHLANMQLPFAVINMGGHYLGYDKRIESHNTVRDHFARLGHYNLKGKVELTHGEFSYGSGDSSNITDHSVDYVLMLTGVLSDPRPESDPKETLKEALRVVKHGGKIIAGTYGNWSSEKPRQERAIKEVLDLPEWKGKVRLREESEGVYSGIYYGHDYIIYRVEFLDEVLKGETAKFYDNLPKGYRGLISKDLLIQIVSSGRLPDGWPRLADLIVRGDVYENGELIGGIGDAVEYAARDTGLTKETKALIIEAIAVQVLLYRGERLKADLDRLGYSGKRDEIIRKVNEIRRRRREGKLNRVDNDFLIGLERLLGYPRGAVSLDVHASELNGKVDDRVRRLKDILELNLKQWELAELARDKKPTGVIVQHIKDLGPGVQNWLEGLKRYNVDMSGVRMAYIVDGVSEEDRRILFATKPPDVILANNLEEIEGESIVYLAKEEELRKVKRSGVVLVKREFGPVIDLSLCLLLLEAQDKEAARRIFQDEMRRIGILPKMDKVLEMWDELQGDTTYLDVWA